MYKSCTKFVIFKFFFHTQQFNIEKDLINVAEAFNLFTKLSESILEYALCESLGFWVLRVYQFRHSPMLHIS